MNYLFDTCWKNKLFNASARPRSRRIFSHPSASGHRISFPAPQSYPIRLLFTCVSIFLVAVGMTLYLCADLIPQPAEGLCLAIEKKSGWKYSNIKTVFDCSLVAVAALITLLATGSLSGMREGTVLTMLSVGKLIGFFMSKFKAPLLSFIGK